MTKRRGSAAKFIERRRIKIQEFHSLSNDMRAKSLITFMQDVRIRPLEKAMESDSEPNTSENSTDE